METPKTMRRQQSLPPRRGKVKLRILGLLVQSATGIASTVPKGGGSCFGSSAPPPHPATPCSSSTASGYSSAASSDH
ncbi:hypothetical protein Ancab_008260 [Ancistrocladus abbreviatus]